MATELTLQELEEGGLDVTLVSADTSDGNVFDNAKGGSFLYIKNTNGAADSGTVTAKAQSSGTFDINGYGELGKTEASVSVPAGEFRIMGPFPKLAYNDSDDQVLVETSGDAAADIELGALTL